MKNLENLENIVKIDTKSFQDLCKKVEELTEENKTLTQDNTVLKEELAYFKNYAMKLERKISTKNHMVAGLKKSNRTLTMERNTLQSNLDQMNSNSFMKAELAAEQHEAETVSALGSFLGDDF